MNEQRYESFGVHVAEERHVPLVVVGGGLSGLCAAIAAARQGTRTILIQDRPVLGGNSSSEIRVHPVGASVHGYNRDARETGLIEELFLEVRARTYGLRQVNGQHYPMWDVILAEKAEAEPNLTLLLNTRVVGVETADDTRDGYGTRVTGLLAVQGTTERVLRLHPELVIDATGDGFIALQSGAPFRYGREGRAEFGESWAPEVADDIVLGSTIMFAARDVGRPVPFVPPVWAHVFPDETALPFRNHDEFQSGYWWLEWGGRLNTVADNETIRRELHAAVFGVWDHIKNRCAVPGVRERAATWALDWIGHLPGRRESRRFEGDYILSERDILAGLAAVPHDVVAYGGWPIDLHAPDGVYSPDRPCAQPPLPGLYGIPLRSLYSRTVANLFLAGRDISATHVAHGTTRVMKTCAAIGEASGIAAAIAAARGLTPRALVADVEVLTTVQQALLRAGVYLPCLDNADPADLAAQPGVTATATSEATLHLDADDAQPTSGWEHAGISTAERTGLIAEGRPRGFPAEVALDTTLAQAVVLSAGRLDAVTVQLRSAASGPVEARLRLRRAAQLRDFGPRECDGEAGCACGCVVLCALVPPGESVVTFRPATPFLVPADRPAVLILDGPSELAWCLSSQEPPGTQAARWDSTLGHWRWLHGTLRFALTPESRPYGAGNVLSGITRPEGGTNLWIADPAETLPQALELAWPTPVRLERVELTFDSQLSGWIWEGTFPLVARDYRVEVADAAGDWATIAEIGGNWQRRRDHRFAPRTVQKVRVTITATNGGRTARLVEARAYGPAIG